MPSGEGSRWLGFEEAPVVIIESEGVFLELGGLLKSWCVPRSVILAIMFPIGTHELEEDAKKTAGNIIFCQRSIA